MIKELSLRVLTVIAAPAVAISLTACEVEQTEEGEAPDVDVEGGNLPEYDVETPDVDVDTREVDVPDTITVPDVDITTPDEAEAEEPAADEVDTDPMGGADATEVPDATAADDETGM